MSRRQSTLHGTAGQEGCRCHAATLASGWLWRADTSCCAGWEVDKLGYKVAGAYCNIEPAKYPATECEVLPAIFWPPL